MNSDVIDFNYLQKRGLIKFQKDGEEKQVVDFTKNKEQNYNEGSVSSSVKEEPANNPLASFFEQPVQQSSTSSNSNSNINIEEKLNNLEFQIQRIIEKLEILEQRR